MWRRVALVRTEDSEELIASIISVKRISELGTILLASKNYYVISSQRASVASYC
jgi:hypothetical protein